MNEKKARKLRQEAKNLSGGNLPETEYIIGADGSIRHHPLSVKGIYRALKKAYNAKKRRSR